MLMCHLCLSSGFKKDFNLLLIQQLLAVSLSEPHPDFCILVSNTYVCVCMFIYIYTPYIYDKCCMAKPHPQSLIRFSQ